MASASRVLASASRVLGLGLEGMHGLVEAGAEATMIVIMILSYLIVVFTIDYVDCIDFRYFIIG